MTAQCDPSWEWASNSLGQNPCAIAGALEAACRGMASYILGPLNNSSNYIAPLSGSALPCECNTVMYSLFMACTACQGENVQTWISWAQNCDPVYVTQYPLNIPIGTAVPHWAYLNVTALGTWSQTDSQASGDEPESTGVAPPVSTITTSTGSSGTGTPTDSVPPVSTRSSSNGIQTGSALPTNTSSQPSGGGSNAGAIAGGVVGGLAVLGIFVALVWYIMKRKQSEVTSSDAFMNSIRSSNTTNYPNHPAQMTYNPSDPSTFPTASHDPSVSAITAHPQMLYHPHSMSSLRYSGAAEV